MLSDAAVADRAAFLDREQRPTWTSRVVAAALAVLRHFRRAQASCFHRTRGADGLSYITVRPGATHATGGQ